MTLSFRTGWFWAGLGMGFLVLQSMSAIGFCFTPEGQPQTPEETKFMEMWGLGKPGKAGLQTLELAAKLADPDSAKEWVQKQAYLLGELEKTPGGSKLLDEFVQKYASATEALTPARRLSLSQSVARRMSRTQAPASPPPSTLMGLVPRVVENRC